MMYYGAITKLGTKRWLVKEESGMLIVTPGEYNGRHYEFGSGYVGGAVLNCPKWDGVRYVIIDQDEDAGSYVVSFFNKSGITEATILAGHECFDWFGAMRRFFSRDKTRPTPPYSQSAEAWGHETNKEL